MATQMITFRIEGELVDDACRDLDRIMAALPRQHGDRFRALERRIEALGQADLAVAFGDVDTTTLCLMPPAAMVAIIQDARALGVI